MAEIGFSQHFKQVMGNYPTGVAIVTTVDSERKPVGMTINSLTSVSMNSLMVLWLIDHKSAARDIFTQAKGFNAHLLASDQTELVKIFSTKNSDRFAAIAWEYGENHLPVIPGAFAVLECDVIQTIEAGDHTLLIGEVTKIHDEDKPAMLYHRQTMGEIPESFYSGE